VYYVFRHWHAYRYEFAQLAGINIKMNDPDPYEYDNHLIEKRTHDLAIATCGNPLKQLPMEVAWIPEIDPTKPIAYLKKLVLKYNSEQFDRLTEKGYRFDMVKGIYERKNV
jgi:hypothetical protein